MSPVPGPSSLHRAARALPVLVALGAAAALPAPAQARHGSDDGGGHRGGGDQRVRATARCGRGASLRLDARARDGRIRVSFELDHGRAGERWRVVVVQEDRVVGRATRRVGRDRELELRRTLRDLPGVDRVSVRASGPTGVVCRVAATLRG